MRTAHPWEPKGEAAPPVISVVVLIYGSVSQQRQETTIPTSFEFISRSEIHCESLQTPKFRCEQEQNMTVLAATVFS
jgi:hypothetical protein